MRYNVHISFKSDNPLACVKALTHDDQGAYTRSSTEVFSEEDIIHIVIKTKDISSLRATLNDYTRLIKICELEGVLNE